MGEYLKGGDPGDELEYGDPRFDGLVGVWKDLLGLPVLLLPVGVDLLILADLFGELAVET
jgi:hypothetical protein